MRNKFRIWADGKMLMPDNMTGSTYRYLLNRDGVVFGMDLHSMRWDGMIRYGTHIMHQIGRKDMEGKETYEGDVVKVRYAGGWLIGVVQYSEDECGFVIELATGEQDGGMSIGFIAAPKYKIIGHIHQEAMQKEIREQEERFRDPLKEAAI